MDAEANKKITDNTLSDKNIIDDNKILHESNLDKKTMKLVNRPKLKKDLSTFLIFCVVLILQDLL